MYVIKVLHQASANECIQDEGDEVYDQNLHIISAVVLLIVSFIGAIFSIITTRVRCLHVNPIIINVGKFFGSGYVRRIEKCNETSGVFFFIIRVVLATGFIHMLPGGMENLTDPCLPDSWNVYGAYGGLFAMAAALIMQLIEFIAHQHYQSTKTEESYLLLGEQNGGYQTRNPMENHGGHNHAHGLALQNEAASQKISTYLLEFGIALHSVLIGLTLGTTTESFEALFIALTFHQFFEAIALGAQIARLEHLPLRSAIFMVIFFTLTTPVGVAVGIIIHNQTYNEKSVTSLLINGMLDSLSAGILIYVALVNLINADMGPGAVAFQKLNKKMKLLYYLSLYAGVAAMAVVGRWA